MNIEYLKALNASNFLNRYRQISQTFRLYESMDNIDNNEVQKVFENSDIPFKFFKKEYFFQHSRIVGDSEFRMHLCPKYGIVETMFYKFESNGDIFGGPISRIQKLIAIKVLGSKPDCIVKDSRFHSYNNLKEVIVELTNLFDEFVETLS